MTEVYKSVTYLVIAFLINLGSKYLGSDFIDGFTNEFISFLTTLLAINIASSSLIASQLKDVHEKTGQSFSSTISELKRSLIIQLILIGVAFVFLTLKKSVILEKTISRGTLTLICNTVNLTIFIYFLDTIYDLGKALFSFLNFKK